MFCIKLLQNDVYKSAGDNDNLLWCCAVQKFGNLFVRQNNLLDFSRCKGCINCDARLWFAVELNKQFHFACLGCAFVTNGEFFHNDGRCVASLVPQFLGDVWRKWCQHLQQVVNCFAVKLRVLNLLTVVLGNGIYKFHHTSNCCVKGELGVVGINCLDCDVSNAVEFLFRWSKVVCCWVVAVSGKCKSFHAVQPLVERLDTIIAPWATFGVLEAKCKVATENVRAVVVYVFVGANNVAVRFTHTVAVRSQNYALVYKGLEWFVKVQVTHVTERLCDKARVK